MHTHEADRRLKESEKRFRGLFESCPDAIFVEDLEGSVLDVNPAACRLHGLDRRDLIGKNVLDLVPPGQRALVERDFPKLVSGEWDHAEGYSWTKEQRPVPVELRTSRIEFSGRPALLLLVRDISHRKQAEAQLREYHESLESEVEERTAELRKQLNLMADREVRMADLKRAIRDLREQLQAAGLTPVRDDPLREMSDQDL